MGTNFYRIPSEAELFDRKIKLVEEIKNLDISPENISRGFTTDVSANLFDADDTPWSTFNKGMYVHLGKRSGGWRFTWNFHDNLYYSNREELFAFIRSGRVVDEYGTEIDVEEFIEMALNWCPDGHVFNKEYVLDNYPGRSILYSPEHYSYEVDGLVVSGSTEFS